MVQTFARDAARFAKMDAVVTIVDAAHCGRHFGQKSEGEEVEFEAQIQYADRILLNKVDVATPEEVEAAHAGIRPLNPFAPVTETINSDAPIEEVINIGAFVMTSS